MIDLVMNLFRLVSHSLRAKKYKAIFQEIYWMYTSILLINHAWKPKQNPSCLLLLALLFSTSSCGQQRELKMGSTAKGPSKEEYFQIVKNTGLSLIYHQQLAYVKKKCACIYIRWDFLFVLFVCLIFFNHLFGSLLLVPLSSRNKCHSVEVAKNYQHLRFF